MASGGYAYLLRLMNEQPSKDQQLTDLDKRVAQLKEYLAAHPSTGSDTPDTAVAPTTASPQSPSVTHGWALAICIGGILAISPVFGPVGISIFPIGLLAFFPDAVSSEQGLKFAQPVPYILYGIISVGSIFASDRWRRTLVKAFLITLALNIGGCTMMFVGLKQHLQ